VEKEQKITYMKKKLVLGENDDEKEALLLRH
jgi:hypothetical protein